MSNKNKNQVNELKKMLMDAFKMQPYMLGFTDALLNDMVKDNFPIREVIQCLDYYITYIAPYFKACELNVTAYLIEEQPIEIMKLDKAVVIYLPEERNDMVRMLIDMAA